MHPLLKRRLQAYSKISAILTVSIGSIVLLGWYVDISMLRSVLLGLVTMKVNTAVCFVLSGLSLLFHAAPTVKQARYPKETFAAVVALIGGLTLCEYVFGWNLGIDELLFKEISANSHSSTPGRMAFSTALNFLLIGASLVLFSAGKLPKTSQVFLFVVVLDSLLAFIGYVYGVESLYAVYFYSSMALHTAVLFVILASGILCSYAEKGLMQIVASETMGGVVVRRLLPAAILVPFLMGWLRLIGERAGAYSTEFGLALFALSNIMIFAILILWSGRHFHQLDLERKRADVALQERERMLEALFEYSPDAILVVNRDGHISRVNRLAENLFGYARDEFINMTVETLIPERYSKKHMRHRNNYRANPRSRAMGAGLELYARRKDGSEFPVDIMLSPVETNEGVAVTAVVRNITERKRLERILYESEDRYRDLVEHSRDLICTHDLEGRILSANPWAAKVLGYDIDTILRMNIRDFLAPEARGGVDTYLTKIQKRGAASGRLPIQTATGERRIWEYNNTMRTEGVATPIVRGMAHDITERMRAEKTLRESEERHRELVENINDVIFTVDAKGVITYISPVAEILAGYKLSELIGKPFASFIHDEDLAMVQKAFNRAIFGHLEPAEYRVKTVWGQTRWVRSSSKPIQHGGEIVGLRGVLTDITERKLAEEELKRSHDQLRALTSHLQSMREEERATIAREIHDELGQALTGVKMDLNILEEGLTEPMNPKQSSALLKRAAKMSDLIDNTIQTVRRISTALRPAILDSLGLSAAIEWQAEEFENRTGIRCECSVPDEELKLDQDRSTAVFRIFQESMTNIFRHARATNVLVRLHEIAGTIVLEIKDNGIGILEEQLQSKNSLGLLGMRERAFLYGGSVRIEGTPEKGTTVTAGIPLSGAQ